MIPLLIELTHTPGQGYRGTEKFWVNANLIAGITKYEEGSQLIIHQGNNVGCREKPHEVAQIVRRITKTTIDHILTNLPGPTPGPG